MQAAPQLSAPSIGDARSDEARIPQKISTEPIDGVNRFLLCSLVSRTAKLVKARAERAGERLPMPAIVKSVLHSYNSAAKRSPGILAGPTLNLEHLRSLLEEVMKEEVRRYAQEVVKNSRVRLAQANRVGDEARIKSETESLERALASSSRLNSEFS
jgi:hypothetical protein